MFDDPTSKILRLAVVAAEIVQYVPKEIDAYYISHCAHEMIKQIDEMAICQYDSKRFNLLLN